MLKSGKGIMHRDSGEEEGIDIFVEEALVMGDHNREVRLDLERIAKSKPFEEELGSGTVTKHKK